MSIFIVPFWGLAVKRLLSPVDGLGPLCAWLQNVMEVMH